MSENTPSQDNETDKKLADMEKQLAAASLKEADQAPTPKATRSTPKISSSVSQPAPTAKTGALWFISVVNFLLVGAAVGAGYWFWLQWEQQATEQQSVLAQHNQQQQTILTNSQDQQRQLRTENLALQENINSLSEKLAQVEAQSTSNSLNLADVSGRRPSDWLIAEADYLVRMAGRKIWLENDVRTAILMLQSADSRLQDIADPSLLPIRQLIATDIQTLQQINPVSLPNIALALSGMMPQVKSLPLALPEIPEIKKREEPTTESISDWEANLDKLWTFFKDELINYKPNTTAIKPLLSEQQQWLAREQLKLALLQAQSAVLEGHETLYQQSLQRALGLVIDHFDLANVGVEQFVSSLQNLLDTNISRTLPTEIQAARPLQDILKKRVDSAFNNGMSEL